MKDYQNNRFFDADDLEHAPKVFKAIPHEMPTGQAGKFNAGFSLNGPGIDAGLKGDLAPWWPGDEGQAQAQGMADLLNVAHELGRIAGGVRLVPQKGRGKRKNGKR